MLEFYQNIPLHIDPVVLAISSFSIGWYAIMYLLAFVVVYFLLTYRIKKKEGEYSNDLILDFIMFALVGAFIGGRLGYVLLYNPIYYWHNLLAIISPYDFATGQFVGIYGMSYHGGLLGVIIATGILLRKNKFKIDFWQFADFVVPVIPAGYFFGRIGNFLNLELYGRVTENWLGMHFPLWAEAGSSLRFPSQLFEAFFEGVALFMILWSIRNKGKFAGHLFSVYLVGYGIARIVGEFFRQPDEQIGYIAKYFTLGQILSLLMILIGVGIYFWRKNKILKKVN
ncbi:MAG: Prolipoprotein diacylglyceryl transferase [Candidatus Moranbacteria bacterium GW2011_GWA2_39_41]|nr:MAG: Prolipoprotein diacylglyceryl transferase [Candidatus Moranbacteria bacterium GW2011_GWA2_39_41]